MRKTYLFLALSLDGYFEGPKHDISWHNVDAESNRFAIELLKETDLYLFGRRNYRLMEASWPRIARDPSASEDDKEIARLINGTQKIVFSKTLRSVKETKEWRNVQLVRKFDPAEVKRLKGQPGKDICVGGPNLALSFVKAGLLDEFRFLVMPVIVGRGTTVFKGALGRMKLELVSAQRFDSGNVLLRYKPSRA